MSERLGVCRAVGRRHVRFGSIWLHPDALSDDRKVLLVGGSSLRRWRMCAMTDQFFCDDQRESYRLLGETLVGRVVKAVPRIGCDGQVIATFAGFM